MQTADTAKKDTYTNVWAEAAGRLCVWIGEDEAHFVLSLSAPAALRLAKQLTEGVSKLPRVAEASDLGIAA